MTKFAPQRLYNKLILYLCAKQKKIIMEQQAMTEGSMEQLEAFQSLRKMAERGEFPDLTLDEINEEIRLSRIGM